MTAKEFIQKKNIVTDYVEGFTDRNGFIHIPLELLLTEYAESQQLLQSCVSSGLLLQTCRKCNSMIFNADGTKCIQCNENHY
jgi:hypothetical protein